MLAVNAAKDATELVAKLRAYHHTAQTKADKKHLSRYCGCCLVQFSDLCYFLQLGRTSCMGNILDQNVGSGGVMILQILS